MSLRRLAPIGFFIALAIGLTTSLFERDVQRDAMPSLAGCPQALAPIAQVTDSQFVDFAYCLMTRQVPPESSRGPEMRELARAPRSGRINLLVKLFRSRQYLIAHEDAQLQSRNGRELAQYLHQTFLRRAAPEGEVARNRDAYVREFFASPAFAGLYPMRRPTK